MIFFKFTTAYYLFILSKIYINNKDFTGKFKRWLLDKDTLFGCANQCLFFLSFLFTALPIFFWFSWCKFLLNWQAAYLRSDPDYLPCNNKGCVIPPVDGKCEQVTCSATLSFHIINFRTDVEFFLFDGGFVTPCLLYKSKTLSFQNPNAPLYGLISSIDSTATSVSIILRISNFHKYIICISNIITYLPMSLKVTF